MGMSPRMKARKGRFGPGGALFPPTLTILTTATTLVQSVANTVDFTAEATDDIDGDLTAVIDWASDLDAASVGTGGTPSITLTAIGTHTITVTAVAPTGPQTVTKTFTVEVTA